MWRNQLTNPGDFWSRYMQHVANRQHFPTVANLKKMEKELKGVRGGHLKHLANIKIQGAMIIYYSRLFKVYYE